MMNPEARKSRAPSWPQWFAALLAEELAPRAAPLRDLAAV
jgi:hypothetical protein